MSVTLRLFTVPNRRCYFNTYNRKYISFDFLFSVKAIDMKICLTCKIEKDDTFFSRHSKKSDGLQPNCKSCQNKINREKYKENPKARKLRSIKAVNLLKSETNEIKRLKGCIFCDEKEPCCLDFHHLDPSIKEDTICQLVMNGSRNRLYRELEKCIVICANHHRKLHANLINLAVPQRLAR